MNAPSRPALRYFGGKWKLAPFIVSHFPQHRTYLEPFGGAASVLLRKPRSHAEVYNDLDGDLVNLFRVLRDPQAAGILVELLRLTPFARAELLAAYEPADDPVERARRLIVRSFQGFGSNPTRRAPRTGFRSALSQSGTTPARDWVNYPDSISAIVERFRDVAIESKPALELVDRFCRDDVLIYADPPYVHSTRPSFIERGWKSDGYAHEMSDEQHLALIDALDASPAMVVLSGYPSDLYNDRLQHWRRVDRKAHSDGGRARTEVLWMNSRAAEQLAVGPLFEVAA